MSWSEHYSTAAGFRWWPNEELVRAVGGAQFGRVLEVGCGNGANLWFLAEHAREVVGVDLDPKAIEAAREYCRHRLDEGQGHGLFSGMSMGPCSPVVTVRRADALALPLEFGPQSFDLVVDCMTSQHLPWERHAALFADYREMLAPGGRLFLFHLDSGTYCGGAGDGSAFGYPRLDLFPAAGFTCMPPGTVLTTAVLDAGFSDAKSGRLVRRYPDGNVASYTVIDAEAR